MTDAHQEIHEAWLARERKVAQAKEYVERRLRENNGPNPGQSAVLVINVVPTEENPEHGYLTVGCLPDLATEFIISALERWISDVREGVIQQEPHNLTGDDVETKQ